MLFSENYKVPYWPSSKNSDFNDFNVDEKYKVDNQIEVFEKLTKRTEYIDGDSYVLRNYEVYEKKTKNLSFSFILERGHLAARMDFLSKADQDKTYDFMNAVPMVGQISIT